MMLVPDSGRVRVTAIRMAAAVACLGVIATGASAQQQAPGFSLWGGVSRVPLPDEPLLLHTAEQPDIRVTVVTAELDNPWSLAFLPDGTMLVTEREGRLRVIRDGELDPDPVSGVPPVYTDALLSGLMEIALHPRFEENRLTYLTYSQAGEDGTIALARARFDGRALHDLSEVFVVESPGHTAGARLVFESDSTLFLTMGGAFNATTSGLRAQDPNDHMGKILRLRDDGGVPLDNPFVGRVAHKPEVYSLGHRNPMGITIHPQTGAVWAHEHSTQGGDEVNVILPGRNYGWPIVSYGREYSGARVSEQPWRQEMEQPVVVWLPSVAPSGMTFYTGDRFPAWRGNLFVGSLMTGRVGRTGHLERIVFNEDGEEIRRESLLTELKQRIRDVRQGPDGLIYVLTDNGHRSDLEGRLPDRAALLRIEPVGPGSGS
jgi:glucose/arabinose dehydrogenase